MSEKKLSTGFAGNTTQAIESGESVEHRINCRMKRLQLVGSTVARWGRIEIHKEGGSYIPILVNQNPFKTKEGPAASDMRQALQYARNAAASPNFEHASRVHMDLFTDEFSTPGTAEHNVAPNKLDQPYGDKHTDMKKMSFPGPDGDEDNIDLEEFRRQAGIKKPSEQFPKGDNAEFDARSMDPGRVDQMIQDRLR